MVTKEEKKAIVADLVERIREASSLFFVDFTKMTVKEDQAFRRELSEKGATMRVAKNTLIRIALAEAGERYDVGVEKFVGQTAIVFGSTDAIGPAKIIRKHFDKTERPSLKKAWIDGQTFEGAQLKQISELPTREDLIAGIIGSIHAPVSGIHGAVNAVMRDLILVIDEVAKKQAA